MAEDFYKKDENELPLGLSELPNNEESVLVTQSTIEGGVSPERREAIVSGVNNALAEEMAQLHGKESFHNEGHIEDVDGDALEILSLLKKYGLADESDELAATTAANGHDIVIEHTVVEDRGAFNYGQRVRHRGFEESVPQNVRALGVEKGNEELSFIRTEEVATQFDPNKEVYTDAVLEKIRLGIAATYPDAFPATFPPSVTSITNPNTGEQIDLTPFLGKDKDGNPMAFKFDQPFLRAEGAGASTLAVAFGDLMYGGKCSPEDFAKHGNDEFRELNERAIDELKGGADFLSLERKSEIAKSMLSWIGSQAGFLLWQKLRFEETMNTFPTIVNSEHAEDIKKDFGELYNQFDSNLIATTERIANASKYESLKNPNSFSENSEAATQLFNELISEMGYTHEAGEEEIARREEEIRKAYREVY